MEWDGDTCWLVNVDNNDDDVGFRNHLLTRTILIWIVLIPSSLASLWFRRKIKRAREQIDVTCVRNWAWCTVLNA